MTLFTNREDAGRALGTALGRLRADAPVLLALPRGGVPVARAAADVLGAELDIVLVRKLGVPWQPELAMGAIGEGGIRVLNRDVLREVRVDPRDIEHVERVERAELRRRAAVLRTGADGRDAPPIPIADRTVVIVDDGAATGATAAAACRVVRARRPRRIVVAVPVISPTAAARLRGESDGLVFLAAPDDLGGVGAAYRDFHQLEDREVLDLLST